MKLYPVGKRWTDFSAICKEDHYANMKAIHDVARVFSIYLIPEELRLDQDKIYIITEANRSHATALYPHEY